MNSDRINELEALHARLRHQLAEFTSGEEWLRWIRDARQFHRYSAQNQLLLALQGAEGLVASYRRWQRIPAIDGNRCQVRRGERGLLILAPMTVPVHGIDETTGDETVIGRRLHGFRPVKVFHQGQLVAPPDIADPPLPELLTGPDRWRHVWDAVTEQLRDDGYEIGSHQAQPGETWNGRTRFDTRRVDVMSHLEAPQRLKTLLHEWAHIALRHDDPEREISRDVKEIEAETVAYLMCTTIGLDSTSYSIPYLVGWSGGDDELAERTARHVLATTATMIEHLERRLDITLTTDPLAAAEPQTPAVDAPGRAAPQALASSNGGAARSDVSAATVPTASNSVPTVGLGEGQTAWTRIIDDSDILIAAAPEPLRPVLTRLMPDDRRALVDALNSPDDPDHHHMIGSLCADAGLTPSETVTLLAELAAAELSPSEALNSDAPEMLGNQMSLFETAEQEDGTSVPAVSATATVETPRHEASTEMAPAEIEHAQVPIQPSDEVAVASGEARILRRPTFDDHLASGGGSASEAPVRIENVLRAAIDSGADPRHLAALTTRLGLTPEETVAACSHLGLDPEVAAAVALQRRGGDQARALSDLANCWETQPPAQDWSTYLPDSNSREAPTSRRAAANAIVQQWTGTLQLHDAPRPQHPLGIR